MEFADIVRHRRMVRRYRPDPVAGEIVDRVLDTARRGPSAGFSQGQSFIVVTRPELRRRIAEICDEPAHVARGLEPWVSVAPVHVIPCVRERDYRERYARSDKAASPGPGRWHVPFWWVDSGAALMLLLLAAVNEGLGAGFLDIGDRDALRGLLEIPTDIEPVGLVTLGYAAATQPPSSARLGRKPWDQVVRRERWSADI